MQRIWKFLGYKENKSSSSKDNRPASPKVACVPTEEGSALGGAWESINLIDVPSVNPANNTVQAASKKSYRDAVLSKDKRGATAQNPHRQFNQAANLTENYSPDKLGVESSSKHSKKPR